MKEKYIKNKKNPKKGFNWILQFSDLGDLIEEEVKFFGKAGPQDFPLDIPIFLFDYNWNIQAAIEVQEYVQSGKFTGGRFKVVKTFNALEKEIFSKIYKELYSRD